MRNEQSLMVRKDLAMRLTGWHSSQQDPIYAVSSRAIDGHPVKVWVFRAAMENMQRNLENPDHAENRREIQEIISAMRGALGELDGDQNPLGARTAIINAMARYFWADAWGRFQEQAFMDGRIDAKAAPMGADLTHVAPETHPEAVKMAKELLAEFESQNGNIIEICRQETKAQLLHYGKMLVAHRTALENHLASSPTPDLPPKHPEQPRGMDPYEFGGCLASDIAGYGCSDFHGDYEYPYCETIELEDYMSLKEDE